MSNWHRRLFKVFFDDDSEKHESSSDEEIIDLTSARHASINIPNVGNIANIQEENIDTAIAMSDDISEDDSPHALGEEIISSSDEDPHTSEVTISHDDEALYEDSDSDYPQPLEDPSPADDLQLLLDQSHIIEQYYSEAPPEAVQQSS